MSSEGETPKDQNKEKIKRPRLKLWQKIFMIAGGIVGLIWWIFWGAEAVWKG